VFAVRSAIGYWGKPRQALDRSTTINLSSQTLKELIEQLPLELQQEVRDFVEFLLEKRARKPKFDWAGALRDLRDRYSSVELQHKIAEWRIGER